MDITIKIDWDTNTKEQAILALKLRKVPSGTGTIEFKFDETHPEFDRLARIFLTLLSSQGLFVNAKSNLMVLHPRGRAMLARKEYHEVAAGRVTLDLFESICQYFYGPGEDEWAEETWEEIRSHADF